MICPVCKNALTRKMYYNIPIYVSDQCGGIWFEQGELKEYIQDLLIEKQNIPVAPYDGNPINAVGEIKIKDPIKTCPQCNQPMKSFNYCYDSNIILDKCPACNGIWTDNGEVDKIAQYHKTNPHVDAIGSGLARHEVYLDKIKEFTLNCHYRYGYWHWGFPW